MFLHDVKDQFNISISIDIDELWAMISAAEYSHRPGLQKELLKIWHIVGKNIK